ncbi:aromatic amino acid transaminase [bacterium]|nr:aromatic amino acid transaminase [bacterium]
MRHFDIKTPELDSTRLMFKELESDKRSTKIDLGIGIYRDEKGEAPVFKAVKKAETILLKNEISKSYKTPAGNSEYCNNILELVLGKDIISERSSKIGAIQIPGAGSGLRIAGELIKNKLKNKLISVPDPTWGQQVFMFKKAGLKIIKHSYYDNTNNFLNFEDMILDLKKLKSGDALLLHGCCHNPTGADLNKDQWEEVAIICKNNGIVPFIDLVYQGLGKGINEDVLGIRTLVKIVPEIIITISSSKTFGVYRDRCGLIAVITDSNTVNSEALETMLSEIARELYFHPPDHAAEIINILLNDSILKNDWLSEISRMQKRIVFLREKFSKSLQNKLKTDFFSFLNVQNGMFSLLPISEKGIITLRNENGIYLMPDGRINIASLPENKINYIASKICSLKELKNRKI